MDRISSLLVCAVMSCGASAKQSVKDQQVAQSLQQLHADSRAQRRKIADLEKELMLKNAAKARSDSASASLLPVLPVEEVDAHEAEVPYEDPDTYDVIGIDDEGVEIVYTGEARNKKSYRVPVGRYNLTVPDDRAGEGASFRNRRAADADFGGRDSESASVGLEGMPTIDEQLRQARAARRPAPKRATSDPKAEYKRYYEALLAGNHNYAVTGFRNFLRRYSGHEYADNAQYWLGEAFYDQKDFESAAKEFKRVVENYPGANKVPDALLKLGYCLEKQGDTNQASQVFNQVLTTFPDGGPARLAQLKMHEISGTHEGE